MTLPVKVHSVLRNEFKIKNASTAVMLRCYLIETLPGLTGAQGVSRAITLRYFTLTKAFSQMDIVMIKPGRGWGRLKM